MTISQSFTFLVSTRTMAQAQSAPTLTIANTNGTTPGQVQSDVDMVSISNTIWSRQFRDELRRVPPEHSPPRDAPSTLTIDLGGMSYDDIFAEDQQSEPWKQVKRHTIATGLSTGHYKALKTNAKNGKRKLLNCGPFKPTRFFSMVNDSIVRIDVDVTSNLFILINPIIIKDIQSSAEFHEVIAFIRGNPAAVKRALAAIHHHYLLLEKVDTNIKGATIDHDRKYLKYPNGKIIDLDAWTLYMEFEYNCKTAFYMCDKISKRFCKSMDHERIKLYRRACPFYDLLHRILEVNKVTAVKSLRIWLPTWDDWHYWKIVNRKKEQFRKIVCGELIKMSDGGLKQYWEKDEIYYQKAHEKEIRMARFRLLHCRWAFKVTTPPTSDDESEEDEENSNDDFKANDNDDNDNSFVGNGSNDVTQDESGVSQDVTMDNDNTNMDSNVSASVSNAQQASSSASVGVLSPEAAANDTTMNMVAPAVVNAPSPASSNGPNEDAAVTTTGFHGNRPDTSEA